MPFEKTRRPDYGAYQKCGSMDKSIYEYCDLTEAEIVEREKKLDAQKATDAEKERKRMARAQNFRFVGGMG